MSEELEPENLVEADELSFEDVADDFGEEPEAIEEATEE